MRSTINQTVVKRSVRERNSSKQKKTDTRGVSKRTQRYKGSMSHIHRRDGVKEHPPSRRTSVTYEDNTNCGVRGRRVAKTYGLSIWWVTHALTPNTSTRETFPRIRRLNAGRRAYMAKAIFENSCKKHRAICII